MERTCMNGTLTGSTSTDSSCPLNDPQVPLISDSEHQVNHCLCYLCTCGCHKCPGRSSWSNFGNSLFRSRYSHYKTEYKKHMTTPQKSLKRPEPRVNTEFKLESSSTFSNDYQPYTPSKPIPRFLNKSSSAKKEFSLVSRSIYKCDFPNWEAEKPELGKAYPTSYRGHEVKLSTKTTYQDHYLFHTSNRRASAKASDQDSWKLLSTSKEWLGSPKNDRNCNTLIETPKKPKRNDNEYFATTPWAKQYNSTYRSSFLPKKSLTLVRKRMYKHN